MESQLRQIGKRIEETRKVLEISVAEMAQITGISQEEYLAHERGEVDHSFTFIYHCAERFGIDISALVQGTVPKLSFYSLTRKDSGMSIKRRHDFEYQHLASNFKKRSSEPFLVTAPAQPDGKGEIHLSTHAGQEFDYVLSGSMMLYIGDICYELNEGDSAYFDSTIPHAHKNIGESTAQFIALVLK